MAHTGYRYNLVALILVLIAALLSNSVVSAHFSSNMMYVSSASMSQMTHGKAPMADMDCHGQEHNQLASKMLAGCGSDADHRAFDQCCNQPLCMSVMAFLPTSTFTIPLYFNPSSVALNGIFKPLQRIESLYRPPIS